MTFVLIINKIVYKSQSYIFLFISNDKTFYLSSIGLKNIVQQNNYLTNYNHNNNMHKNYI